MSVSANAPVAKIREPLLLFTNALGGYGASPLSYTAVALSGIVLSCFVWFSGYGRREADRGTRGTIIAACLAAAATYLTLTVWLAPIVFGQIASFRYAVPVLIGVVPAFVALAPSIPDRTVRTSIMAAFAAVLVLFIPSTTARMRNLISSKSTLAFLSSKDLLALLAQSYAPYLAEALGQSSRERIEKIQSLIPAGEPIVSWLMTPYWLNFRRNPVYTVDPYGLAMPWTRVPAANYYMWEYRGFVVRSESRYQEMMADAGASERLTGVRALSFMRELEAQAKAGHLIFNDGFIAVWRTRDSVAVPFRQ